MGALKNRFVKNDLYSDLKQFTQARIAVGRAGCSMPLNELLEFKMSHAHARDAVYSELDLQLISNELKVIDMEHYILKSKAINRSSYLSRPDWGRNLSDESFQSLKIYPRKGYDVSLVLADGLSASAINQHALPLLHELVPQLGEMGYTLAPLILVQNGRVAIADQIASLLQASLSIIFIGERPGLTCPDSMGAYLTYDPKPGLTDESRNCISNISVQGLDYITAAERILYLVNESMSRKLSGVLLKEISGGQEKEEDKRLT
ncbi:ethanolamine ammonia-lyase subunit EutC [Desertivirga arenae]|uniref:ethanolamine ammonia-lyase subunit EutC n=1 Tax=Desertivirga arenae TaxID=2810309 RepID=UPI001A96C7F8|nr:ethanolamine ammonia-lyase subunit EutC [Pedobacter sp. SYSU D00823]